MLPAFDGRKNAGGARLLTAMAVVLATAFFAHAAVEVITLAHRNPGEVLPIVQSMLSPEGRATADERTNAIIVVDSEEVIAQVRKNLAAIDRPVPQALVRVQFLVSGEREDRSLSGGVRVGGDAGSVSAGRPVRGGNGFEVRVEDRSKSRSGSTEAFIRTLSGSWAYISVGRDIPFTVRWGDLCRRYGQAVVFQRMETGFEVKPVIQEGAALVEIVPRLTEMGSAGRPGVVRFAAAGSQLRVPLGQWVSLAGSDQAATEAVRAILEAGSSRQSAALSIRLMVESPGTP